jgi:hypothetical protein
MEIAHGSYGGLGYGSQVEKREEKEVKLFCLESKPAFLERRWSRE